MALPNPSEAPANPSETLAIPSEGPLTDKPKRRAGRGPSKKPTGRFIVTEVSETGEPLAPHNSVAPYKTACGVIVRDKVPVTYRRWKDVPDTLKDDLWTELMESFEFPEGSHERVKHDALMIMDNSWKNLKTTLNRHYVKKGVTPDFVKLGLPRLEQQWDAFVEMKQSAEAISSSEQHTAISKQNKYPHRLGTAGYKGKIPQWERQEEELIRSGVTPITAGWAPRSKHWVLGRATASSDGSLSYNNPRVQEVSQRIADKHVESSEGSFQADRENDELSVALGNKEHPGRTRGVGARVGWGQAFPEDAYRYRKRKISRADREEQMRQEMLAAVEQRVQLRMDEQQLRINEQVQQMVQLALSQQAQRDNTVVPSPPGRRSSCASTPLLQVADQGHYPVDDITVATPCKLHVPAMNISIEAAVGMAYPCEEGMVLHNRPLAPGYAKVQVDMVHPNFVGIELDMPQDDEVMTLGQAIHCFIQWRKRDITLDPAESSSPHVQLPRSSPLRSTTPTPPPKDMNASVSKRSREKCVSPPSKQAQEFFIGMANRNLAAKSCEQVSDYDRILKKPHMKDASYIKESCRTASEGQDPKGSDTEFRLRFEMGQPLLPPSMLKKLTTQMRHLHSWYMERSNQKILPKVLTVRFKEEYFHRPEDIFYIEFSLLQDLFYQNALDVQVMRCWTL